MRYNSEVSTFLYVLRTRYQDDITIAFSTSPKTHFGLVKRLKMSSQCLATTWNIALSTSLKSNLDCPRGWKWIQSFMAALETSFYRLRPSRILGLSRVWKWLLSAIRPLESSFYRPEKVAFWAGQGAENYFKVPFDNLINRLLKFTQIDFWAGQ